jgi:hypothetical protein
MVAPDAVAKKKDKQSASQADGLVQNESFGRPKQLENNHRGLYVWCDRQRWHVMSATQGQRHVFTGMIHVTGGKVTGVANFKNMEAGHIPPMYTSHVHDIGTVNPARDRIAFKFTTKGARDGFTFSVDESARQLEFQILRDGIPLTNEIFVGAEGNHPTAALFALPAQPSKRRS